MRMGIVVASIVVAWAEPVTFATWNVLSIPKCSLKANGFPYFKEEAFNAHNKIVCGKKEIVYENGKTTKSGDCSGAWISGAVADLFKNGYVDILVVQEIDYFHYKGLEHDERFKSIYQMAPLLQPTLPQAEDLLKSSLRVDAIPKDIPFVLWNTRKISALTCSQMKSSEGLDVEGVGKCKYTTKTGQHEFIGMHAGGDAGFNTKIAGEIGRLPNIDVVLGDFNMHSITDVSISVALIDANLFVPALPENSNTVYRFIHPARKLFQAFDNHWRHGLATKVAFKCEDLLKDKDKLTEKPWDVFKSAKKYVEFCEAIKIGLKDGKGKLLNELRTIKKLGLEEPTVRTDWTKFAKMLGLENDLMMTTRAAQYVSMEVKQEDYIAYNKGEFEKHKPEALIVYKEKNALQAMAAMNRDKETKDMEYFPIEDMASDHLPVILHLERSPKDQYKAADLTLKNDYDDDSKKPTQTKLKINYDSSRSMHAVKRVLRKILRGVFAKS